MKASFKKSSIAALLAGGLLIPSLGMAQTPYTSILPKEAPPAGIVFLPASVWTEELGEVPVEKYTLEELAKMVDDYWTEERLRNATPIESLMPDCSAKALQETEICAAAAEAYGKDEFWTAERVQKAIAVKLPMPDGSVRRALIANEEEPVEEVSLPAALPLAAQAR